MLPKKLRIFSAVDICALYGRERVPWGTAVIMIEQTKNASRIVVKVGSSTLTYGTGLIHLRRFERLVKVLSDLRNEGKEIVLVSSGAVSAGAAVLGLGHHPATTEEKQATAAVGQSELMRMYSEEFSKFGHTVAQILMTKDVIDTPVRRSNAESTFKTLLSMHCIPIVNENDSVSFEELNFGGNDTLSAYVALICEADLIVNMSDIDGFYNADPRTDPQAERIPALDRVDESVYAMAGGAGTRRGTGGMVAKLRAAQIAEQAHIPMMIVNGVNPDVLYDIVEGKTVGTIIYNREA